MKHFIHTCYKINLLKNIIFRKTDMMANVITKIQMLKNTQFIIFKLVTYSILNIKICAAITSPMIQDSKS